MSLLKSVGSALGPHALWLGHLVAPTQLPNHLSHSSIAVPGLSYKQIDVVRVGYFEAAAPLDGQAACLGCKAAVEDVSFYEVEGEVEDEQC